jgi:hypothetical protein
LEKTGLNDDIRSAVRLIEGGRIKHFTNGTAEDGLLEFQEGCALLKQSFTDVKDSGDIGLILSAEYYFLTAEIAEGNPDEALARSSSEVGLEVIDDAIRAYKALQSGAGYKWVDLAYPLHDKRKWRYRDMPKDAFHVFCESHTARLQNGLKRYGVSSLDRDLINLRIETLAAIEDIYHGLQRKAVEG